jgi:hypothetical protein
MLFTMRLFMLTWDRWQNDLEPPPPREYLLYMLAPPLILFPPYMLFIPFFTGFRDRVRPGLTVGQAQRAGKKIALALAFAGLRGAMHAAPAPPQPLTLYWDLVRHVLDAAVFAHLVIALLSLHGIEERMPLDRPLLTTRFLQFWQRYQVHQKDAQVFLFFVPALLRLRRLDRYAAFWLATAWTMLVGNSVIHIATRYLFLPNTWDRIEWAVVTNLIMTVALAAEMCVDEWRSRHPSSRRPRAVGAAFGWAITQTLAALATGL